MNRIQKALGLPRDPEAGLSLVEVIVAMMVFSIISIGVAFSITNSLVLTGDSRARETASNLAAQTIDLDRSVQDVFSIVLGTQDQVVGGTTYHIKTTGAWVAAGTTTTGSLCGAGGGALQYFQVSVDVSWTGQASQTADVHSDTEIAPNSRINDPTLGTIIVSVKNAAGAGAQGVTVAATPTTSGLSTPTSTTTDANGCAFLLKVQPGAYNVGVTATNGIDYQQKTNPTAPVTVTAATSVSQAFSYDTAASMSLAYAGNTSGSTPTLPTNLTDTFISTTGGAYMPTTLASPMSLFPYNSGYSVIAGAYVPSGGTSTTCLSPNPSEWTTAASDGRIGKAVTPTAAPAGGSSTATVGMGAVTVNNLAKNIYLTAVNATPPSGSGDPGCAQTQTYTFPKNGNAATQTIFLPYGSWTIYQGASSGSTPLLGVVGATSLQLRSTGTVGALTGIVTLDPRTAP